MKKYKLLKDLPCAEAGEIFQQGYDNNDKDSICLLQEIIGIKPIKILLDYIDDFDEWFEEIEEPEEYFIINFLHLRITKISIDFFAEWVIENLKSLGLLFKTEEEAEKYIEYLKAKAIIKQDAKGAHFDWTDTSRVKYYGVWNCQPDILNNQLGLEYRRIITDRASTIYFKTKKDLLDSFKKHPEEWKVYLTYEQ